MAVVIMDGRVRVSFCTSIANIALPTTTELNAGTALEGYITPDGLVITPTTGKVDTSNVGSTFTTNRAGRKAFDIKLKIHHDGTTDVGWNLLPYRTNGYLVVRKGIDKATAYATGQGAANNGVLQVFPIEAAEPDDVDPQPDSTWDFEVELYLTGDPNTRAQVA
jgi:hypothetical protein